MTGLGSGFRSWRLPHTAGGTTPMRGLSCGSILGAGGLEPSSQGGVGSIHSPFTLSKQGGKNHGKLTVGLCKQTHCLSVCTALGANRQGFLPLCRSWLCTVPSTCKAARCGRGRQQNAQAKITWGFICKTNGAGGSGFPQAVKKGCIERPGWAEHRGCGSLSPSAAPQQTQPGNGNRHCRTERGKRDLYREQGRDQLMELGQAQFWMGLSRDCRLWGQSLGEPFPSPITVLLGFSGVSLRVVLAMGIFFYWWYLFHAIYFHKTFALSTVVGIS